MNSFIAQLVETLRKEKIETLLVKGQGIAQCYDRPFWRASGDIDLFLDDENYERAKEVLEPLADSVEEEFRTTKHQEMMIGGWDVELHGTLYTELKKNIDRTINCITKDTFEHHKFRKWQNGTTEVYLPIPDNDVIFVFTHILQHFFKWGIGLRQICDWCRLLWVYRGQINTKLLERRLKEAGIETEWLSFAAFAVDYLGMSEDAIPLYRNTSQHKKNAEQIMHIVLKCCNMGHNRDTSYYTKSPYVVRKIISLYHHTRNSIKLACVFPMDSIKIWNRMIVVGVRGGFQGK